MLGTLAVVAVLCALAIWAIARVALAVLARLGVDLMTVLLWLGLAEWPVERLPERERRATT